MLRSVLRLLLVSRWPAALLIAALLAASACRSDARTPLTELDEARALTADLSLQLNKLDKGSARAVMADTDEASVKFANEARAAAAAATTDLMALRPLLDRLGFSAEIAALRAFESQWSKYQELIQEILTLAVENTNLKAQRLSFGPAREAADAFRDAVITLAAGAPARDRCSAGERAQTAIASLREIQALQAPHIAEADDAAMTRLEQAMATREQDARLALKELSRLSGGADAAPSGTSAWASLERFAKISSEILALSRRNTNVRSLALALREQPALATGCESSLQALRQALASRGSKATR